MDAFGWTQMQLFDEERRLRQQAEVQVRAYNRLLEELALTLAPDAVEEQRRLDPSFFQRLTIDGWQAFFMPVRGMVGSASRGKRGHVQSGDDEGKLKQQIATLQRENEALRAAIATLPSGTDPLQPASAAGATKPPSDAQAPGHFANPNRAPSTTPTIDIQLPEKPPTAYFHLFRSWPREGLALAILAKSGWSLRHAIAHELSAHIGISSRAGSLKRMFVQMQEADLWRMQTMEIGRNRAVIVMLTELGRAVVNALNIEPITSEWEEMLAAHGGEAQNKHTALVCTFTHQARLRAYTTQVCPQVEGNAEPDVRIEQDDESIYVEVEAESGSAERRMKKWRNQSALQGFVALCAPTPEMRFRLVAEARAAAKHGKATDVSSLMRGEEMWIDEW